MITAIRSKHFTLLVKFRVDTMLCIMHQRERQGVESTSPVGFVA
jgi:hypothetical protein